MYCTLVSRDSNGVSNVHYMGVFLSYVSVNC